MHQTEWATKEWGVEICTIDSDFVQFFFFLFIYTDDLSICQPQTGLIIVRHIIRVSFRRIDAGKSHRWSRSLVEESMAVIFVSDASHLGEPSAGDQATDGDPQHEAVRSS